MSKIFHLILISCSLAAFLINQPPQVQSESIDNEIERFCYPDQHKNTRKSCECNNVNEPPWGIRAINIDCSYKDLQTKDFNEVLPLYVQKLDLSWNALDKLPMFTSDSLRLLNLMHNNITALTSKNFVKIANLHELYLSWNSIQSIEWNTFDGLTHLRVLDLSHNNLHALSLQTFKPLLILETLNLSWNRQLNESEGIIEERDFYQTFGVNGELRVLKLEACNLVNITLPEKAPLEELYLRRNRLTRIPKRLPLGLQKIDISENLLETLKPNDTMNLQHVKEFYIEDMLRLMAVEANSLYHLKALEKISFQNDRRLISIDRNAFGNVNTTTTTTMTTKPTTVNVLPPLKSMIFRGTMLRGFNDSLAPIFRQLEQLDCNGMPLHCDCELIWIKREVNLETNGRCFKPSRLRGMLVSSAHATDLSCDTWPRWVYGLIIFFLIILCSVGIYCIVLGLRPHNGVTLRKKVGAGSPYARVTIEPNQQESLT